MGNIFSGKLSTSEFMISLFIPLSQLYFRLVKLDGSLDKPWLLFPLLLIFPFSLLPTLYLNWGSIAKGTGGKPYDNYMYIPIIFYVLLNMMLKSMRTFGTMDTILRLCGLLLAIMFPYYMRESVNCDKMEFDNIMNIVSNSSLVLGISYMCLPLISLASYFPFVGLTFSVLSMIRSVPIIGESFLWGLWYLPTYMINNVFQGLDINNYCTNNKYYTHLIVGLVLGIVGINLDNVF